MEKLPMCRICLAVNVRMYIVFNRNLHKLYEKLTDIPFVTEDIRPVLVCFFCCAKLKQCYRLLRQCLEAEELFAQRMNEDYEPNPLINQNQLEFSTGFITTPIQHFSIYDEGQTESIAVKEELQAVWEGLDEVIEPKEKYETDEMVVQDSGMELQEEDINMPSTSSNRRVTGVASMKMELTIEEWLCVDNASDDEDLDVDINMEFDTLLPELASRTATSQPADDAGLSSVQVEILQREDQASNQHLCSVVSSNDYFDFHWTRDRQTFTGTRETFSGIPGPTFDLTDMKPIDVFYKMFDNEFIDMLVTETNRYADQTLTRLRQNPSSAKFSRLLRWKPTDRDEMLAFLAVMILQGLYPKVKEEACFSYDGFGTTPYFASVMSYNRYHLLKTFQHFIDNETCTDTTNLNKIRPVIDFLNDKFSSLYYPGQEVAIDESLLKWHGRLSFSQKINTIAAQVGVKTYELCESSSGYLWKFIVYTGKDGPNRPNNEQQTTDELDPLRGVESDRLDDEQNLDDRQNPDDRPDNLHGTDDGNFCPSNATAKIVYELMEPLLHRGHTLIMDNFYNSPLLARCLKRDAQTDVYGTLRINREFVPETIKTLTKTDMRPDEIAVTYCSDLAVMLWRDANFVSMISTYHPLLIGSQQKHNKVSFKPCIVLDYDKSMGGVDRKYQYLASQPLERQKNKVWYKKLFRRLYNVAIFNCFVIFTSNPTNKLSHRQFRTVLSEEILKVHRRLDLKTEPRLLNCRRLVTGEMTTPTMTIQRQTKPLIESNHFPIASSSRYTRCWICTRNKKSSRTKYKCEECNVNLCILGCFKDYHKNT